MSALQSRWGQLLLGIVCMVMIANLQYGWTLFVLPISQATGLEPGCDPGRLHRLRHMRDVAAAARGLCDRPHRTEADGLRGRRADRRVLGAEQLRRVAEPAVWRGGDWRHRRRVHLRRDGRQRDQVVPGPARIGGGADGGRLRRRVGGDGGADLQHDRQQRLPGDLPPVRRGAGRRRGAGGPVAAAAAGRGHPARGADGTKRHDRHPAVAAARHDPRLSARRG